MSKKLFYTEHFFKLLVKKTTSICMEVMKLRCM